MAACCVDPSYFSNFDDNGALDKANSCEWSYFYGYDADAIAAWYEQCGYTLDQTQLAALTQAVQSGIYPEMTEGITDDISAADAGYVATSSAEMTCNHDKEGIATEVASSEEQDVGSVESIDVPVNTQDDLGSCGVSVTDTGDSALACGARWADICTDDEDDDEAELPLTPDDDWESTFITQGMAEYLWVDPNQWWSGDSDWQSWSGGWNEQVETSDCGGTELPSTQHVAHQRVRDKKQTTRAAHKAARKATSSVHVGSKKWQCQFTVGIEEEQKFRVCRRLLGHAGANMKAIAQKCGGVRLRLRGQGSKFLEENGKESSDPLMLCLTSPNAKTYKDAVAMVWEILEGIYTDYDAFCEKRGENPTKLRVIHHEGARSGSR